MNEILYLALFLSFFIISLVSIIFLVVLFVKMVKWKKGKYLFPRKTFFFTLSFLVVTGILYYNQYYNLDYLPSGEMNTNIVSPNGKYSIKTYHFTGIYGENAKAVLVDLNKNKEKTIYFNRFDYDPYVEWVTNDQVVIGEEKLNIHKDTYDYRYDPNALRGLTRQRLEH